MECILNAMQNYNQGPDVLHVRRFHREKGRYGHRYGKTLGPDVSKLQMHKSVVCPFLRSLSDVSKFK